MLRRRLLERLLLPALIAGACGGESADLFDSSGSPTATGGDDDSAGEGPEVTGGKATAAGGSNGGVVAVTGGRASAGAVNGGSSEGGEPSGGVESGGRPSSGGRTSTGGSNAVGGENQGGGVTAGAPSGGVAQGGANQGGKGGANQGGATVAGSGGKTSCTDSDGGDQKVRGTTQGTNGTFEDECDDGDLLEHSCEMVATPGPCVAAAMSPGEDLRPAPPIDNCQIPTGKVIETRVECGGRCERGTCFYWCPTLTDEVLVTRDGTNRVELTNQRTEDVYSCEIAYEAENFDCRGPMQGRIFQVFSVGLCDAEGLTVGVDTEDEPGVLACSYSCTYE